jgi:predicted secreted protein
LNHIREPFKDHRSRKVAIVAHCILNQNSRVQGLAERSSILTEIVDLLEKHEIGIVQMPCPELTYAGVFRKPLPKEHYDNIMFRRHCRKIAKEIVDQIQEYSRSQTRTILVIGFDGSPSCGVTETSKVSGRQYGSEDKYGEGAGILIEELRFILDEKKVSIPFFGVRYETSSKALAEIEEVLQD